MSGGGRVHAIVLAGDHAWDRSPVGRMIPRALLPVVQTPLVRYVLRWLQRGHIDSATLCVNQASRVIRRYLGEGGHGDLALDYYEDRVVRGPAGCARDAASFHSADRFVVVESTVLTGVSIPALLQAHATAGAAATVALGHDPLVGEATDTHFHPAGVWVFERDAFGHVAESGYQDIKEVLIPRLHGAGQTVYGYEVHGPCPRVRDAASYLAVSEWMLRRWLETAGQISGYRRVGSALVHETATVDGAARLLGPVVIGPHSFVASSAVVVGPTVLGGNCRVGPEAVVSRSVLWDHAEAQFGARLDQSIVTNGASVPARALVDNQIYMPERLHPLRFSGELATDRSSAPAPAVA